MARAFLVTASWIGVAIAAAHVPSPPPKCEVDDASALQPTWRTPAPTWPTPAPTWPTPAPTWPTPAPTWRTPTPSSTSCTPAPTWPTPAPNDVPDGTLNPLSIPKYVTPLVIPPVMKNKSNADDYDIAVRQFQQQILPGGIWNNEIWNGMYRNDSCTYDFPATPVWSYGPAADPLPDSTGLGGAAGVAPASNSQFNYPAYTVENVVDVRTRVDWINELIENPWNKSSRTECSQVQGCPQRCRYIQHLFAIDRSLHWANPEKLPCAMPNMTTDCRPDPLQNGLKLQDPYDGPVPWVTHVHGAHAQPESDGYPEAWYLPDACNIPAGYATQGVRVNNFSGRPDTNVEPGVASFEYANDQPSSTLWYHDHSLGMTRNNVMAGPAGFWLLRTQGDGVGAPNGTTETFLKEGTLPHPPPWKSQGLAETNIPGRGREDIREIPIAIQARSFYENGSLFYPSHRSFFHGLDVEDLQIPFLGDVEDNRSLSDISKIWNPEAFFNVMVVNGVSWPFLEVKPLRYRFRFLNGCNSRFLNLILLGVNSDGTKNESAEIPFYQIGGDQSLLPHVVKIEKGRQTKFPGGVEQMPPPPAEQGLLLGPAERADVIVDFAGLPVGARVRLCNTAPDGPFSGDFSEPADPDTTGQVMEFWVIGLDGAVETSSDPESEIIMEVTSLGPPTTQSPRDLALLEEESQLVCYDEVDTGRRRRTFRWEWDPLAIPDLERGCVINLTNSSANSSVFGPAAAVLGSNGNGSNGGPRVTLWADPIATKVEWNSTEVWEFWDWTMDAHPIHVHLVKFEVVEREDFDEDGVLSGVKLPPNLNELGWKDTVLVYPQQVTRVKAQFDIIGLYVWHCHILEHEDNEMMVPYCVYNSSSGECEL